MKFTTASAAALAANTASAATSWANWQPTASSNSVAPTSQQSCPATLTVVTTTTEIAYATTVESYQKTITVPIPDKPNSVNIKPTWAAWTSSSAAAPVCTSVPTGCSAGTTVTSTSTSTWLRQGTTTVYKSTIFVGVAGAPAPAPTAAPSGKGGNGGSAGPGGIIPWSVVESPHDIATIGSNAEVFTWVSAMPTVISTGAAPEYTQKADGSWGGAPVVPGSVWGDWPDNGNSGSGSGSGSGNDGGSSHPPYPTNGTLTNGTHITNGTIHTPGGPGSNVTAPMPSLADSACNSAGNRGAWCDGRTVVSDIENDYLTGKNCVYDFVITAGTLNFDGTDKFSFLINGQSPGPLIECNWGDQVIVNVHNQLTDNGTAIHWHGIRQVGTNDQDGVPGVTECAVAPGESRTYTFIASSYGTSWYHSHWGRQYGDGVRGPMVIHGPATADYDVDAGPVMVTDTFNGTVEQQGWIQAHVGPTGSVNYLLNGHNVVSDLSSGQHALWTVKPGKKYLFRFINAAVQNMYAISIDDHEMTVISADFIAVKPYTTSEIFVGIGQRYDVVVEMNQAVGSYFLRAVTQNGCAPFFCANTGLGQANGIIAYEGVPDSPYLLPTSTVNGNKAIGDYKVCQDEPLASLVPYVSKTAGSSSAFSAQVSTLPAGTVNRVQTTDDGSVFRWTLNNAGLYINYTNPTLARLTQNETADCPNHIVLQQKDAWYYFVIQNQFSPGHPMHLHGHDFSILGQGIGVFNEGMVGTLNFNNPARRDTAMLMGTSGAPYDPNNPASGYTVIGFQTDNPGAWLMHCHILWHVDGGLGLQWIERPSDIIAADYADKPAFKEECSTYATFEAEHPEYCPLSGSSGLKRSIGSLYADEQFASIARGVSGVVRRDNRLRTFGRK